MPVYNQSRQVALMQFGEKAVLALATLVPLANLCQAQRLDQPPRVAPPSCDISLMTVGNVSGSQNEHKCRK
jgi:hypothetical protein